MNALNEEQGHVSASILPHAPILIPALAGNRVQDMRQAHRHSQALAKVIVESGPDVVCIISSLSHAFGESCRWISSSEAIGRFQHLGYPDFQVSASLAREAGRKLQEETQHISLQIQPLEMIDLIHDFSVPISMLQSAGFRQPFLLIGVPDKFVRSDCVALGSAIAKTARKNQQNWHLICSGELSHRHWGDMPLGFHPCADAYDSKVLEVLRSGSYDKLLDVEIELREEASEDLLGCLLVGAAAVEFKPSAGANFHYEVPVGIGQLVGRL